MRGNGGCGVDHRIAQCAGVVALCGINPDGVQAKCGIFGGDALQCSVDLARADGELSPDFDFALSTNHPIENNSVVVGVECERITNANRLHQVAEFGRELFAHALDAIHELAACLCIDEGD